MAGLEGKQLGDCEVLAKLGQGGMGAVYKARQTALDRLVAIKVLPPQFSSDADFITRFKREAASAARLTHPNIVQVYSAGKQDETNYFVMEFVDGESVQQRLLRKGRVAPGEALAICMYVAQGLDYAWKRNKLIHRDIKPDNIFLSADGEVKIGDLGLAKSASGAGSGLTMTGAYMGTPYFISPEQARGLKEIDFRADIYSLGCTLYYMISGHRPYESEGCDALQVMFKHVNEPAPDVVQVWPQCPAPLAALIATMVQKQPADRFQSYEDLIAEMKNVAAALRSSKSHVVVPLAPAVSRAKVATPAPPGHKAPGKVAQQEQKPPVKAVSAKEAKPSPAGPASLKPPAAEPKEPSFGWIMVGTVAVCLLGLGVFLWAPWQDSGVGPAPAATAPSPAAGVPPAPAGRAAPEQAPSAAVGVAFFTEVAALPPEQQVERVVAQLKAMNPDYNGKESHQIENGAVVQLALDAESIRRLAPVAALRKLQKLSLTAPRERQAALGDLSPLTGLQLTALDCNSTQVTDLSPLSGQPLEDLNVRACHKLLTLAPLKGMKLRRLNISNNMALADFSALQDMPLESFEFIQTRLRDLELLRGAPLQRVRFFMTEVRDLSPLRGAPLKDYEGDAGLLNDPRNLDVLRSVKTLERIQGKTAAEFWKQVDAQPPPPPVVERLPEAGDAAWQKAVNLLPLIDPAKDAVEGVWRTAGGTLKVGAGKASRVQLPYLAPEEYDFRMEFARQSGTGAVWQVLNQGGKSFTWCLAGWDGKWMGFESIGGKVVNQNVSGVAMAQNLVNGRRYVSLVEVRKDGVKAYLDGRFVTAWKTDYADMSLDPALRLRDARALGLGAGQSALTVYQVAVREVTGQGTLARTAPVAQTPTVADADRVPEANDAAWKNSLDVLSLIEPERDTVRGEWARDFEKLVGDRNAFAAIEIPYRPPEEYDYRVEFTPTKRGNIGALHLAKAAHAFTFNFFGAGGALFGFEGVNGELIQSNQTARRMVPVEVGKRYVVLVEVRNNEVRAFLNTCFVTAWKTDYSDLKTQERWQLRDATLLGLGCQSRVEFHGARVREVTGKGAFLRQPPPAAAGAEGAAPGARIRRD